MPPNAGHALSASADPDSILTSFSQLVVDSGFADQCLLEACVSSSHDASATDGSAQPHSERTPRPAPSLDERFVLRIPLVSRGVMLGAMSLVRFGAPYTQADGELGEILGWCAALVVDHAALAVASHSARARADEAERFGEGLVSLLAHDLHTTFTTMLAWVRMLHANTLHVDGLPGRVEAIERIARAGARIVEDLLDLGRMQTGELSVRREPTQPADVLARAVESARDAALANDVQLELQIFRAPGIVVADAARLEQVVRCLIAHAVRRLPRGGRVLVRLEGSSDVAHVRILAEEAAEAGQLAVSAFDERRRREAIAACRLQLALAERLIELHGGRIFTTGDGTRPGAVLVASIPALPGGLVSAPQERKRSGLRRKIPHGEAVAPRARGRSRG